MRQSNTADVVAAVTQLGKATMEDLQKVLPQLTRAQIKSAATNAIEVGRLKRVMKGKAGSPAVWAPGDGTRANIKRHPRDPMRKVRWNIPLVTTVFDLARERPAVLPARPDGARTCSPLGDW